MTQKNWWLVGLVGLGLLSGCGGSNDSQLNAAGGACVPGRAITCGGPDGCTGTQTCKSDGSGYGVCECGSSSSGGASSSGGSGGASSSGGGNSGGTSSSGGSASSSGGSAAGGTSAGGAGGSGSPDNPVTCADAEREHSSIGCDFWPTVTPNLVWSIFDFAAVVVNPGQTTASVTVTHGGADVGSVTVAPGASQTIYLPWVQSLKGPDTDVCGNVTSTGTSARVNGGAYHLTSTAPVSVYQFNAAEYQGSGGPAGKDWSSCPGNQECATYLAPVGCYSFSNDASLLLPTTALGQNYVLTGYRGSTTSGVPGPFAVITATANGTMLTVKLSAAGSIVAGSGVTAVSAGGTLNLTLNAGDVALLQGDASADLGGSTITTSQPVQVIAGSACAEVPDGTAACDHLEESVLPSETLGKHYFVTLPTGPSGTPVPHVVRLYGLVNGTTLTYSGTQPVGSPTKLNAGQAVGLGQVTQNFELQSSQPIAIDSFLLGSTLVDSSSQIGDPSETIVVPVSQYRTRYVFVAPSEYQASFVDVVEPSGTVLTLDGAAVPEAPTLLGSGDFSVVRVGLLGSKSSHVLTASAPVGVQVLGYGTSTSYEYPGGLDLQTTAR
jgi:IgGFc binding protein